MKSDYLEQRDVQQLAAGDINAFNRLYAHYHKPVHANILKLVHAPELASELLQDVFLSLWQNRFKFESRESVGGWLFVVSYNKSLNCLRKKLKETVDYVAEYPHLSAISQIEEDEEELNRQLALIDDAIETLPARKKEVFMLCRYEGRSKADVAALLGISQQSVSDYLKQSNKAIKMHVMQHYSSPMTPLLLLFFLL
ncbi:sigma-70 family RNA polymerase sigma factor [Sphingobacterium sp. lm-10]|uniref:RNA polymerase sigma factor n=1 Tax=Sphingobacterium sp. lm-10 TaxID=2944904 RepID=UPI00201FE8F9|nr:sigma-70 family RNA polymerase sigma factor [Sphingobacterium sp. lm-10]MCL7987265.1 sigma-70 family RNA polymerase sigma factor [Sphingobacterium sp. lm-10]